MSATWSLGMDSTVDGTLPCHIQGTINCVAGQFVRVIRGDERKDDEVKLIFAVWRYGGFYTGLRLVSIPKFPFRAKAGIMVTYAGDQALLSSFMRRSLGGA